MIMVLFVYYVNYSRSQGGARNMEPGAHNLNCLFRGKQISKQQNISLVLHKKVFSDIFTSQFKQLFEISIGNYNNPSNIISLNHITINSQSHWGFTQYKSSRLLLQSLIVMKEQCECCNFIITLKIRLIKTFKHPLDSIVCRMLFVDF